MNKKDIKKNLLPYVFLLVFFIGCLVAFKMFNNTVNELTYDEFLQDLNGGKITELTITPKVRTDTYKLTGKLDEYKDNEYFILYIPQSEEFISKITAAKEGTGSFKLTIINDPEASSWLLVIANVVPYIILGGLVIWVFTKQLGGGNKSMDFGKSRAKLVEESKATFKDVAGLTEEKEEVQELIDFLKNPKKFTSMGARIPKGVLLVGPPGTGKTLLARAVAGEAKVPFYYISGSDFVELFVGIGASRVRDMFTQAKMNAPCLIFIDEIDAVGRQRGTGLGGGHDEREQTLNQLLTEMDGFGANEGIIIIAATNRPDVLDPALLRPGRFDRQVVVGAPDMAGREAILKVHARKKPLGEDVDLSVLAKNTSGFSGADLENMLNEAALLAARRNKTHIDMQEIEDAIVKVIVGTEKKSKVITDKEKKLTAYHEAGHAVVSKFLPTQDPVHQVSIVPRGRAGGYTMYRPNEDKSYRSKTEMEENIVSLLGGRVAEKMILDDISTGAQNDLQRATATARNMVTKYGMSDLLGPMTFGDDDDEVFLGRGFAHSRTYSEEVAKAIDSEISRIVLEAYQKAESILREHIEKLHAVAQLLLEKEKIDGEEFNSLFE